MNKTILVTGGLGYIGSHTVVALVESGYDVIIIDDLSNSHLSVSDSIKKLVDSDKVSTLVGNINAPKGKNNMFYALEHYDIDAVIHFAAFKSVSESVKHPLKYYDNNVSGLITLLNKMEEVGVKDIIFSSSCTVYGDVKTPLVNEHHPLNPMSTYGHTKKMCEDILIDLDDRFNSVILRYFNPIGCHDSGLLSDTPKGRPENLMPNIIDVIKGDSDHLLIFGDDYNTKDGTAERDYIDVNDLASAHIQALDSLDKGHKIINIGTGTSLSVMDIVNAFESLGKHIPYKITDRREGDIEAICCDVLKMRDEFAWLPRRSLKQSLESILNYLKVKG